ncbi:MAG: arsenate reductase ArsC [Candidatus Bathyarchaeia archaeon]
MVTVLFICVHNAGRSQMTEAFFNKLSGGRHRGINAGSKPAEVVNPVVVEAMHEVGIDISGNKPKKLTKEMVLDADLAITMGCGEEACPVVPNDLREWQVDDPHGKLIDEVRLIRDEILRRVKALIVELNEAPPST